MAEAKAIRTVRKAIDAVSDDDEEALVSLLDPEVEWRPTAFLTGEAASPERTASGAGSPRCES